MEGHWSRYLYVFDDTLTSVSTEAGSVELEAEAMCSGIVDLYRRVAIELGHAFNFDKFHEVAVLERVAFVLMHVNDWVLGLLDTAYDE